MTSKALQAANWGCTAAFKPMAVSLWRIWCGRERNWKEVLCLCTFGRVCHLVSDLLWLCKFDRARLTQGRKLGLSSRPSLCSVFHISLCISSLLPKQLTTLTLSVISTTRCHYLSTSTRHCRLTLPFDIMSYHFYSFLATLCVVLNLKYFLEEFT